MHAILIVCSVIYKKDSPFYQIPSKFAQSRYICMKEKEEVDIATFADNPQSVMILSLTERERKRKRIGDVGGWRKQQKGKEKEREREREGRWNGTLN